MDDLIRVINELQDAASQLGSAQGQNAKHLLTFNLPQIAVVGSQSAGKSSVLEGFVGKDFLPRGSGIVTRRPLILQLLNHPYEYGEFSHCPGKKISNFEEIRLEIQRETDRVTGQNKGISPIPINLKVYSPHVLDLTLVDLPGLTKVPIGDQPKDIEMQIRNMIRNFIEHDNCLILAVSPANADLANSDALQLAKIVDPEGERTIGVLTKLDLMDQGTDAKDILENKVYPLKYGYIGVVNRSQKDIDTAKDIGSAVAAERRYFLQHPVYRNMIAKLGTQHLQKSLNMHLTRHIAQDLPRLKNMLLNKSLSLEQKMREFMMDIDYSDPSWKMQAAIMLSMDFSKRFSVGLVGNSDFCLNFKGLSKGAEIRHIFHVKYPLSLASVELTDEATLKREIGFTIQNVIGVRTGIFTPDKAFDHVIRSQIGKMRDPTMMVLELVTSQIVDSLTESLTGLHRFPQLSKEIESLSKCFVLSCEQATRDEIKMLIDFELAYINAKHEDFVGFNFANQSQQSIRALRKNPAREVVYQGWLTIGNKSFLSADRMFWFVLTCETLSWYKDDRQNERYYSIMIEHNLRFFDYERNNRFCIFHNDPKKNIYKTSKGLDLVAKSLEEMEEWKVKLINVGIYPKASVEDASGDYQQTIDDPHLTWQVETIWVLVDSYMRIVRQNLQDLVPKAVVHSLIQKSIKFFEERLISQISRHGRIDDLMTEDPAGVERRKQLQLQHAACRKALDIMNRIDLTSIPAQSSKPSPPPKPKPVIPSRPAPVPVKSGSINDRKTSDITGVRPTNRQGSLRKAFKLSDGNPSAGSTFYTNQ